ncbi:MAG TPA: carbohydrate ABC transporter permease [Propionibacteriaceae bacterium]|nr:carbohydrate ABC transporter permease [Propionibacteriaceae bacterium]
MSAGIITVDPTQDRTSEGPTRRRPGLLRRLPMTVIVFAVAIVIFVIPFVFIVIQALKTPAEASSLSMAWPRTIQFWSNLTTVIQAKEYDLVVAFINSAVLTVVSVTFMVLFGAMTAFIWQRRRGTVGLVIQLMVLAGLVIPPAVVPTVWVLQSLGLFKTMPGLMLIEITFHMSFCVLLFRGFVATIPREIDEAAIVDGAGPLKLFFTIIFPLLKPVIVTVVVVQSVAVFNDFVNPLYFLPGYPTVQLTLYNYISDYLNMYNLLFMNVLLITIPPLVVFVIFNRQMVAGMTSGAVKG